MKSQRVAQYSAVESREIQSVERFSRSTIVRATTAIDIMYKWLHSTQIVERHVASQMTKIEHQLHSEAHDFQESSRVKIRWTVLS